MPYLMILQTAKAMYIFKAALDAAEIDICFLFGKGVAQSGYVVGERG